MERLTFNVGRAQGQPVAVVGHRSRKLPDTRARAAVAAVRHRYDADYLWMIAFTAILFFRPQDHLPALQVLHLAEVTALGGLAAMAARRLAAGQSITKVNGDVVGVVALGALIVLTIPFSTWPGGSVKVFSDVYVKIILIFALMVSTLTTAKRLKQTTWLLITASGYIAFRAVLDYARGVNLTEGDRVRGALGGFFENPNDLALNLVTFLAPTLLIVLYERRASKRLFASLLAVLMVGAIVCTKSRSGFLGLAAMLAVIAYYAMRARPGLMMAGVFALVLTIPALPSSFWNRMNSIVEASEDPTGSREARIKIMEKGLQVFAENPLTGVGAGQFQNYDDGNSSGADKWRVTHNVWLQVATELGVFGLVIFGFLVVRAYQSCQKTLRLLRGPGRKKRRKPGPEAAPFVTDEERAILEMNGRGMLAAVVGWTVCAFFASVAFNWTFYYVLALAVAGREVTVARWREANEAEDEVRSAMPAPLVRAHA
jgi:putative inorganic carbon (HCO3(-)) transporter